MVALSVWAAANSVAIAACVWLGHGSGAWILLLPLAAWPGLLSFGRHPDGAFKRHRDSQRLCLALCALPWIELGVLKGLQYFHLTLKIDPVIAQDSAVRAAIWLGFLAIGGTGFFAIVLKFRARVMTLEATRDFYRAQVREVDLKNQAMISAIPDHIFLIASKGTVLDYNFRGRGLFPDESRLLGRPMLEAHPPSAELRELLPPAIRTALETRSMQLIEYRCETEAGPLRFEARLVPSGPDEVMMFSRDITREWERERELEQRRAQMITSSRLSLLGEMAGGVAHEINNPLAIIQGHASLLQSGKHATPESIEHSAQKIEDSVLRISRIVQSLRVFARETSDDPVAKVRVSTLLAAPLELCREKMRSHGVRLTISPVAEDLEVHCQPAQISQALLNLISNAFDAVRDQPREGSVEIEVSAPPPGHAVEISVADNGPGVPVELRERVFEPFFTTKEPGRGTGLGLSFSLGVAQKHGGSLHLASPKAGDSDRHSSRFVLRIPRKSASEAAARR